MPTKRKTVIIIKLSKKKMLEASMKIIFFYETVILQLISKCYQHTYFLILSKKKTLINKYSTNKSFNIFEKDTAQSKLKAEKLITR